MTRVDQKALTAWNISISWHGSILWTEGFSAPGRKAEIPITFPAESGNANETDTDALCREIKEELSVDLERDRRQICRQVWSAGSWGRARRYRMVWPVTKGPYARQSFSRFWDRRMVWFAHADKDKSSLVDKIIFDWLKEKDLIDWL